MKRFFKKRWHRIPVALVSALLILALTAGGAFAAYGFLKSDVEVTVGEAIAVGVWAPPEGWDNLEPYGLGDISDVDILIDTEGNITITAVSGKYVGDGFTAGEWIVIPLNIRNGSDGSLDLSASVSGGGGHLTLESSYEVNVGACTAPMDEGHEGQCWARNYKAQGAFTSLNGWSTTIPGNSGESGSAVRLANVLFIKISAPGDAIPGTYIWTVTLYRN